MKKLIAHIPGSSSTGTPHGLLIEKYDDGAWMVTVTGANGKKRHASVQLTPADIDAVLDAVSQVRA